MEKPASSKDQVLTDNDKPHKIIVKFSPDLSLPFNNEVDSFLVSSSFTLWNQLKKQFPGIRIYPAVKEDSIDKLKRLISRACLMDPEYLDPGFLRSYVVVIPSGFDPIAVSQSLAGSKEVESAAIERVVTCPSPTVADYTTNDNAVDQRYLDNAPTGISSKGVWNPFKAGSDGDGISFIDIENGWNLNHVDLVGHSGALIGANPSPSEIAHGTRVLGVVAATDNDDYCIGIAPNLDSLRLVAFSDHPTISAAIVEAADHLNPGDVLLIEGQFLHTDYQGSGNDYYVPIEVSPGVRDTIRAVTTAGIIVVEPGGNGSGTLTGFNFRDYMDPDGFLVLNPDDAEYIDSGAIIVTASFGDESTTVPGTHEKINWAPYGKRVDCYAWGEKIFTLDSDDPPTVNNMTTNAFGGTSGAAAIIAGAVASIQGMVQAKAFCRLSPLLMRTVLKDIANGTNLHVTGGTGLLGIPMPDLATIFTRAVSPLPALNLIVSKTDVTCFGADDGTATANATGGTGTLAYAWSTVPVQTTAYVSGLAPGTYTVVVKDSSGCLRQASIEISQPAALYGEIETTLITCNHAANGSIGFVSTSGGISPYLFSVKTVPDWQTANNFTMLGPGTYTPRMKDSNGCIKPFPDVILTDPAELNAVVNHSDSTGSGMNNGSIIISNPAGGYGTYEYSIVEPPAWSDNMVYNNLPPGTYYVRMRDLTYIECVKDLETIQITEPAPSLIVNHDVKHVVKFGDSTGRIDLTVTGGTSPYNFLWSNGATSQNIFGLKAGDYSVTVTDSAGLTTNKTIPVRHLYFETAKIPVNSLEMRFLIYSIWPNYGSRYYKIKWKGRLHPPAILHPHPNISLIDVSVGTITESLENGQWWCTTSVKVPALRVGKIIIRPPHPHFPRIFHPIIIPVKIWALKRRFYPWFNSQILVGEFNIKVYNDKIEYSL